MGFRNIFIAPCALLLIAADYPPPPPQLAPYIQNDRLEPGDFGWMRGRFDDASKADKDAFHQILIWASDCRKEAETRLRAQLVAQGFSDPHIDSAPVGPLLCQQVASRPFRLNAKSYAEFQRAVAKAGPIAQTFLAATALAERIGGPRGPALADELEARPLGEQMLRTAWSWGTGEMPPVPELSPDERAILISMLSIAMAERDHDNTEWLKKIVAEGRWPAVSQVGERASSSAWLLVQHADADPLFQLQALRLMEPLLPKGEVSKQNYAYLYDRVMLKLTGKQRYATQMGECRAGKRQPLPLEDPGAVARWRKEADLDPLDQYQADMDRIYGACPAA